MRNEVVVAQFTGALNRGLLLVNEIIANVVHAQTIRRLDYCQALSL